MKKIYNIILVIVLLCLSGCSGNLTENDTVKQGMIIKPVSLVEDESIKLPPDGFIPYIYDYVVNEEIKTMLIEIVDYTDSNKPNVVNSYTFKLNEETLQGRIYIKYFIENNELSIDLKSKKGINKISTILEIYDKTDGTAISSNSETVIKKGMPIPIYNILYADSFSDVDGFLKNPKYHADVYSSAYQITITFFNK